MRGTHLRNQVKNLSDRIIPADAGNTCTLLLIRILKRDHPRGCGEHSLFVMALNRFRGSSPRMRGTPYMMEHGAITVPDHPRGCGEHTLDFWQLLADRGSSPRMRGTLDWVNRELPAKGIIPADAGNTPPIFGGAV